MIRQIATGLSPIAVTFWVGALWTVGLVVLPTLFHVLPDRQLAGSIAGRLISYTAYISLGCGAYLLLTRLGRFGTQALKQALFWTVVLMLVLAAAGQFGVQPIMERLREQALPRQVMESMLRDRFATWHGVASVLYLIECVAGVALVLLQARSPK